MSMRRDAEMVMLGVVAAVVFDVAAADGRLRNAGHAPTAHAAPLTGPGRRADAPSQIPARGWWPVLKRVAQKFLDDRAMTEAAAVTFYGLLALFPALAALVSLYGLFADPSTVEQTLNSLSGVLPGGGMQIITQQVHALASHGGTALGFGVVIGLAVSLWSANSATKSLFDAVNVVYEQRETRSYLRLTLLSLAFTLGGIVFILIALAGVVVLPAVLTFVGLGSIGVLLDLLRWPLLLLSSPSFCR
jgi:membrane protein